LDSFPGINDFAERRRILIARSDQLRGQLAADIGNLRPVVGWIERGYSIAVSLYSFLPIIGGLAGFMVGRRKTSVMGKVTKAWSYWRIGRKMFGLIKDRFFSRGSSTEQA
jgi:hypothetical protein